MELALEISRLVLGLAALLCMLSPTWRMTGFIIFSINSLSSMALITFFEYQALVPETRVNFLYCLIDIITIYLLHRWAVYLSINKQNEQLKYWGSRGWFRMALILFVFVAVNFIVAMNIITYDAHHIVTIFWRYYVPIIIGLNLIQSFFLLGGITHGFQYIYGELGKYSNKSLEPNKCVRPDSHSDHNSLGNKNDIPMLKPKNERENR